MDSIRVVCFIVISLGYVIISYEIGKQNFPYYNKLVFELICKRSQNWIVLQVGSLLAFLVATLATLLWPFITLYNRLTRLLSGER